MSVAFFKKVKILEDFANARWRNESKIFLSGSRHVSVSVLGLLVIREYSQKVLRLLYGCDSLKHTVNASILIIYNNND